MSEHPTSPAVATPRTTTASIKSSTLKPIRLLPPELIHRIAAGEIVDRPASVLKELIENALDAGSTALKVSLVDGGLQLIQVEDNGWGLSRADLEVCIQRHATSKISKLDDLESILTLGFRGEALSAIASVSRLTIDTFRVSDGAWSLNVVGGAKEDVRPGTRKRGTKVSVADLFFNIPARRKFLRKPSTEAQECQDVLESLALIRPEIAFEWHIVSAKGELKSQRQLPPQSPAERFLEIQGVNAEPLSIRAATDLPEGVRSLEIIALRPPLASPTQKNIRLAVNGRLISDKRLPYALREAYTGLIEIGDYPRALVSIEVDPTVVDVNIHPQKKEVRRPAGFSLGGLAYSLLRPHFELEGAPSRTAALEAPAVNESLFAIRDAASFLSAVRRTSSDGNASSNASISSDPFRGPPRVPSPVYAGSYSRTEQRAPSAAPLMPELSTRPRPPFSFRELRVVGEVGAAWIVCESPAGLVLIDQHAAHERVNFERILKTKDLLRSKPLLMPLILKLPLGLSKDDPELKSSLESLGFEFADAELMRDGEIEFIAVPDTDRKIAWDKVLEFLFDDLAHGEAAQDVATRLKAQLAASLACHGSIRRGQRLSNEQIRDLLQDLSAVEWGGLCPHGRPVWFQLDHAQIEEAFHR